MPQPDLYTERSDGNLGRRSFTTDKVAGLIMNAVQETGGVQNELIYQFNSLTSAEGAGFTEEYDDLHKVLCYHHIKEFFRLCSDGRLYVMTVEQGEKLSDMADISGDFGPLLMQAAKGEIRVVGFTLNPDSLYTSVPLDGLDNDTWSAVAKAQQLMDQERQYHRPSFAVVEGRNLTGSPTALQSVRNISGVDAPDVCVVIGADNKVSKREEEYEESAAVGTLLGSICARKVNENPAWVTGGDISSLADDSMMEPGLSSGDALLEYTDADLNTLHDKGMVMVREHIGLTGVYWNDLPTCTAETSDFTYGENVMTWNKAAKLVRKRIMPFLMGPIRFKADGTLAPTFLKNLESEALLSLEGMEKDQELDGASISIDPKQNVRDDKKVRAKVGLLMAETAREIIFEIGFTTSL